MEDQFDRFRAELQDLLRKYNATLTAEDANVGVFFEGGTEAAPFGGAYNLSLDEYFDADTAAL